MTRPPFPRRAPRVGGDRVASGDRRVLRRPPGRCVPSAALPLLLAGCGGAAEPPAPSLPPPIRLEEVPAAYRAEALADMRVIALDVRWAGSDGTRVAVERVAVRLPSPGDTLWFETLDLRGVRVSLPPSPAAAQAGSAPPPVDDLVSVLTPDPTLLEPLTSPWRGPALRIGRLSVTDAVVERRSATEGVAWRATSLEAEGRDILLDGVRDRAALRLGGRLSGAGVAEPVGFQVAARRAGGSVEGELELEGRGSRASVSLGARRAGGWSAEALLAPLRLASLGRLSPLEDSLAVLRGGIAAVARSGDAWIEADSLTLASGSSRVLLHGRLGGAGGGGLLVAAEPLSDADLRRLGGPGLPGGGEVRARALLAGDPEDAIRVQAELVHGPADGSGGSALGLDGTIGARPEPWLDLAVAAHPVRAADTAWLARLRLAGPSDSLSVTGQAWPAPGRTGAASEGGARVGDASAAAVSPELLEAIPGLVVGVDARLLLGGGDPRLRGRAWLRGPADLKEARALAAEEARALAAEPASETASGSLTGLVPREDRREAAEAPPLDAVPVAGRLVPARRLAAAEGSVVLARDGGLDVALVLDSLPLAGLPDPERLRDVRGFAHGSGRLTGTLTEPSFRGELTLADAGFEHPSSGVRLDSLGGTLRLRDRTLATEGLEGRLGGGRARVAGALELRDEGALDLRLEAWRATVSDRRDLRLVASADLDVTGSLRRPMLRGTARIDEGRVREDELGSDGVVDPDDPPFAELARRVPWPAGSPLRKAPPPRRELDVDVLLEVDTTLSIWDEDSDLQGEGRIRVHTRDGEVVATGLYAFRSGFYAFFGETFRVVGGAFRFTGDDVEPWVSLQGEHLEDEPLGAGRGTAGRLSERVPPMEVYNIGFAATRLQYLRGHHLIPATQAQLGAELLYREKPDPVPGWTQHRFWRERSPSAIAGTRAATQGLTLFWSYAADEAYDYIPMELGYFRGGVIEVGSRYPGLFAVGPVLRASARVRRDVSLLLLQPLVGSGWPGLRARWSRGETELDVFAEPRFQADVFAGPGHPGYTLRRGAGVSFRWRRGY